MLRASRKERPPFAPRFFRTLARYSCQTILSFSSSLTTAPCMPAARSCGVTAPVPKLAANAMPPARTEIASAVESTPVGVLILFLPSSVWHMSLPIHRAKFQELPQSLSIDAQHCGRSPFFSEMILRPATQRGIGLSYNIFT